MPDLDETIQKTPEGPITRDYLDGGIDEDEDGRTVIGETPNGKTVQVVKRREGTGYVANFREGGELPPEFRGWFTSYQEAERTARIYLKGLWQNAKDTATKTG